LKQQAEQVLEARSAFDRECALLRPDLHRFCARMTGSLSDGEDVVQEALVHAFYRLPELREGASLRAWLFRIAHNRCIDLLRSRRAFVPLDDEACGPDEAGAALEDRDLAQHVLVTIFTQLPPKERAAVVLKDVLGYSLEETADITSSSVGAIKAAVHRARGKLDSGLAAPKARPLSGQHREVVERYVARFNAHDWDGVRALLAEDARLEVVERIAGPFDGRYFQNYAALREEFRLECVLLEGAPAVIQLRFRDGAWRPHSLVLMTVESGRVSRIRDYVHIPYVLCDAHLAELE
jgi:RNA polymerase sigma-70 factor, ECF subfamily